MAMTMLVLMMRLFVLMHMLTIEDDDGGFECDGDAYDDDYGCSDDGVIYGDVDNSMWPTVIVAFF